jgi:tryptophan 2-C-methyltransferase
VPTARDAVDNAAYFRLGGQAGVETKRGCPRRCIYCADPLAKGAVTRLRDPAEVADEFAALAGQGCDVIHLCDGEFNIPGEHASAVCDELIRRRLAERVRWYTYMAVLPFDAELAGKMRRAGCVGINFTSDAAAEAMLRSYRLPHRKEDLTRAVGLCREHGMAVMLDLLLGGPGETPETLTESIEFFRRLGPDCVGAPLGLRIYPGTPAEAIVAAEGPMEANPAIRRKYAGSVDLLWPTFYISAALGRNPARLVREVIAGDRRFFEPEEEPALASAASAGDADLMGDHNYNANEALVRALAAGQRGAYWDILRKMRGGS